MRVLPDGYNVEVDGGGVWPTPHDHPDGGLEWRLRYASPERVVDERYVASGIVQAYRELIFCTDKRRRQVVRSLRTAIRNKSSAGGGSHD